MSILSAANLGQYFGTYDVFHGISASIPNDAKVGLVGPNGIGKTTLLLILAGLDSPQRAACTWRAAAAWAICARRPWTPSPRATTPSTPRC